MKPRTRARTPSSIASNQSSKSKPSAATAASFVVSLVMAWSPFQRANAGIIWVEHPETTPTQFQPLPRRDPVVSKSRARDIPDRDYVIGSSFSTGRDWRRVMCELKDGSGAAEVLSNDI